MCLVVNSAIYHESSRAKGFSNVDVKETTDMYMEACGVQEVQFTGGEALIRKDFWEIVDALTASDIKIDMIYSNGLLMNGRLFQKKSNLRDLRIGA